MRRAVKRNVQKRKKNARPSVPETTIIAIFVSRLTHQIWWGGKSVRNENSKRWKQRRASTGGGAILSLSPLRTHRLLGRSLGANSGRG